MLTVGKVAVVEGRCAGGIDTAVQLALKGGCLVGVKGYGSRSLIGIGKRLTGNGYRWRSNISKRRRHTLINIHSHQAGTGAAAGARPTDKGETAVGGSSEGYDCAVSVVGCAAVESNAVGSDGSAAGAGFGKGEGVVVSRPFCVKRGVSGYWRGEDKGHGQPDVAVPSGKGVAGFGRCGRGCRYAVVRYALACNCAASVAVEGDNVGVDCPFGVQRGVDSDRCGEGKGRGQAWVTVLADKGVADFCWGRWC